MNVGWCEKGISAAGDEPETDPERAKCSTCGTSGARRHPRRAAPAIGDGTARRCAPDVRRGKKARRVSRPISQSVRW
eukprot:2820392-Prymnesium_polylepis.1